MGVTDLVETSGRQIPVHSISLSEWKPCRRAAALSTRASEQRQDGPPGAKSLFLANLEIKSFEIIYLQTSAVRKPLKTQGEMGRGIVTRIAELAVLWKNGLRLSIDSPARIRSCRSALRSRNSPTNSATHWMSW